MRRVSLILLLFCALVWLNPSLGRAEVKPVAPPEVKFWLTILHNSHGESELINLGTGFEDFGGIARFATVVSNLRAQATVGPPAGFPPGSSTEIQPPGKRGVILINGGDNFLAGPEWNASLQAGVPYYDAVALDLMGYDAMGLGNHEFDFGPEVLADFIESFLAPVPFVSANLDVSQETRLDALFQEGQIARSVIVRERGESIGIVSAITPQLPFVSSPRNVIVDSDVVAAVQAEIEDLQSRRVNKIVLISHLQDIFEDLALASQLSGVDVMVAGGSDELLSVWSIGDRLYASLVVGIDFLETCAVEHDRVLIAESE